METNYYGADGICCTEIPVMMLLQESDGYKIGPPGKRAIKRTHSLFTDDLKTYQQKPPKAKDGKRDLSTSKYGYRNNIWCKKCTEIVFKNDRIIKGEGLQIYYKKR